MKRRIRVPAAEIESTGVIENLSGQPEIFPWTAVFTDPLQKVLRSQVHGVGEFVVQLKPR
jgi:hypothetical protein